MTGSSSKSDKARIIETAGEDRLAAWARKVLLNAVEQRATGPANGSGPSRSESSQVSVAGGSHH